MNWMQMIPVGMSLLGSLMGNAATDSQKALAVRQQQNQVIAAEANQKSQYQYANDIARQGQDQGAAIREKWGYAVSGATNKFAASATHGPDQVNSLAIMLAHGAAESANAIANGKRQADQQRYAADLGVWKAKNQLADAESVDTSSAKASNLLMGGAKVMGMPGVQSMMSKYFSGSGSADFVSDGGDQTSLLMTSEFG